MANSELTNKKVPIGEEMSSHLKRIFNAYKGSKDVDGYQRLRGLCDNTTISYEQLKRIKNFFDNFNGNKMDTEYLLNGGTKMKNWVNQTLNNLRVTIKNKKDSMSNIGMPNQHQKNNSIKPSSPKINTHDSDINKIMRHEGIYNMKILDDLITEINKNKKLCLTDK